MLPTSRIHYPALIVGFSIEYDTGTNKTSLYEKVSVYTSTYTAASTPCDLNWSERCSLAVSFVVQFCMQIPNSQIYVWNVCENKTRPLLIVLELQLKSIVNTGFCVYTKFRFYMVVYKLFIVFDQ